MPQLCLTKSTDVVASADVKFGRLPSN